VDTFFEGLSRKCGHPESIIDYYAAHVLHIISLNISRQAINQTTINALQQIMIKPTVNTSFHPKAFMLTKSKK